MEVDNNILLIVGESQGILDQQFRLHLLQYKNKLTEGSSEQVNRSILNTVILKIFGCNSFALLKKYIILVQSNVFDVN